MPYPQAFLEIKLTFARKMATLTGQPVRETVLWSTALYRMLGLDWSVGPEHPALGRVLAALERGEGREGASEVAYRVYRKPYDEGLIPDYEVPRWGCFAYEYAPEGRAIHLHFANLDASGYGPLSHQRRAAREAELWSLFSHLRRAHPEAERVQGSSWLYNREAYQRLFPPAYAESAQPAAYPNLITRGLWEQFLRYGGTVNERLAAHFLQRVADLRDAGEHAGCFPYVVLLAEAPIACFYEHYGVAT
jgi:hypothetical protein